MGFRFSIFSYSPRKLTTALLRHKAQRKLQKAVATGKVKKPTRCQRCKKAFPKAKLHGHHRSYKNPLDNIEWYCQSCHYKNHSKRFQAMAEYRRMQRLAGIIGH
jgi:formate-dependent nitrite reductase cytochrome c552 subunit